jgi:AAA family ATP:ADP antiporter
VLVLGVALTLGVLPALTLIGFGAIALLPTVMAVAAFQVIRRAADYGVARPARELLYTVAPREDRYKAKSIIDTVIYRTGDQVGAWSFTLLRALGMGVPQVSLVAMPLAALWLVNALWLGRRQERLAAGQPEVLLTPATPGAAR